MEGDYGCKKFNENRAVSVKAKSTTGIWGYASKNDE
jgi:hypothetical protein